MTTTKSITRTTGTKKTNRRPRITKREKRIMQAWEEHAEGRVSDDAFFRDQRLLQTALGYFTTEEAYALARNGDLPRPSEWGTRFFTAQFLPILSKAVHRRDAMLKPLLADLEQNLPWLVRDYATSDADLKTIMRRVRSRLDSYVGPPNLEAFYDWVVPQVANTLKALDILRKVELQNTVAFAEIYRRTYSATWAGVLDVLKSCHDLGATHEVAEELVNVTFGKIFADIVNWRDDGEASLTTRVYEFARDQALGWRTERVREKQRRSRLLGGVRRRRRELRYPTGAKKPSADAQNEL